MIRGSRQNRGTVACNIRERMKRTNCNHRIHDEREKKTKVNCVADVEWARTWAHLSPCNWTCFSIWTYLWCAECSQTPFALTHTHTQKERISIFIRWWRLEKRKQSRNGRRQRSWWCLGRCVLLKRSCEVVAIVKLRYARFTHIKVLKIIIFILLFLWSSSSSRHVATCSLLYYLLNNLWIAIKNSTALSQDWTSPSYKMGIYFFTKYLHAVSERCLVSDKIYYVQNVDTFMLFFLFFFSSIKSNNRVHHWVFSCSLVRWFTLSWIIIIYISSLRLLFSFICVWFCIVSLSHFIRALLWRIHFIYCSHLFITTSKVKQMPYFSSFFFLFFFLLNWFA